MTSLQQKLTSLLEEMKNQSLEIDLEKAVETYFGLFERRNRLSEIRREIEEKVVELKMEVKYSEQIRIFDTLEEIVDLRREAEGIQKELDRYKNFVEFAKKGGF